jgi:hypothetical protein
VALAEGGTTGQTWVQVGEQGPAFLLAALIGLGREIRGRRGGVRQMSVRLTVEGKGSTARAADGPG